MTYGKLISFDASDYHSADDEKRAMIDGLLDAAGIDVLECVSIWVVVETLPPGVMSMQRDIGVDE